MKRKLALSDLDREVSRHEEGVDRQDVVLSTLANVHEFVVRVKLVRVDCGANLHKPARSRGYTGPDAFPPVSTLARGMINDSGLNGSLIAVLSPVPPRTT